MSRVKISWLNIVISEGKGDRVPSLYPNSCNSRWMFLSLRSPGAVQAAKQATKTIPIVMVMPQGPLPLVMWIVSRARVEISLGLPDSPGTWPGNGSNCLRRRFRRHRASESSGADRVGGFKGYEAAAQALKIPFQSLEVRTPNPDLESVFQAAKKSRANALVVVSNIRLTGYHQRIVDLAIKNRLPSMYETARR